MKNYNLLFLTILLCASLQAQEASFASRLRQFSPLADIHIRNLGLEDKNGSGTIDRGAGEGYETFIEKYGNADTGFHANGVIIGADNGRLEENEIINHYYINIRFKDVFREETINIDNAVKSYVYANSIPLVWLDDTQGTVMNAVNRVLGEGWNEREVSEDEAVKMFERAMNGLSIIGRTGNPHRTGYYTLSGFINHKTGYCFEVGQFGFWFFSELKKNSVYSSTYLTRTLSHGAVQLYNPNNIVDYFKSSFRYSNVVWEPRSPLWSISQYYLSLAEIHRATSIDVFKQNLEQAVIYDKYNINALAHLVSTYNQEVSYEEISAIGDFIFGQIDLEKIMKSRTPTANETKDSLKGLILYVAISYSMTNNRDGFEKAKIFLNHYFGRDNQIQQYLRFYQL